jgi:hypothetical protein
LTSKRRELAAQVEELLGTRVAHPRAHSSRRHFAIDPQNALRLPMRARSIVSVHRGWWEDLNLQRLKGI